MHNSGTYAIAESGPSGCAASLQSSEVLTRWSIHFQPTELLQITAGSQ